VIARLAPGEDVGANYLRNERRQAEIDRTL